MKHRHAIITGGSSGIGLEIAKILAGDDWNISLIARNKSRLQAARDAIQKLRCHPSQRIEFFSADVSDQPRICNVIREAVDELGPPALLVTSAGSVRTEYFRSLELKVFEELMAVNYLGTVYAVKTVVPYMLEQGDGHIVMISSGAGFTGLYGYTAYSPSKFAVRGFAESLRQELKHNGIRVSVVFPPDTDTPQFREEVEHRPAETILITGSGGLLSPEFVARAIIKGIKRNRFMITPGINMTLLGYLHSLLNPILRKYFDYLAGKIRN